MENEPILVCPWCSHTAVKSFGVVWYACEDCGYAWVLKKVVVAYPPEQPESLKIFLEQKEKEKMDYFTADFHWGDERLELLGRPFKSVEESQEKILEPLLSLTAEDNLYVLGDVAMDEKWLQPIEQVKARKHLFRGNYDSLDDKIYMTYFESVQDSTCKIFSDPDGKSPDLWVHMNHYPSRGLNDAFNLTAHIHGCWRIQKNMLNVGIDAHHFEPVSLRKLFFYYNGICNFYDQDVWVQDHPANLFHKDRGKAGTYWQRGFKGTRIVN